MIRKGIIIDPTKFEVVRECEYDDKRIDGLFYKVDGELLPIAYIYPIEHQSQVKHLMLTAKEAKIRYDKIIAEIYYTYLPQYRE